MNNTKYENLCNDWCHSCIGQLHKSHWTPPRRQSFTREVAASHLVSPSRLQVARQSYILEVSHIHLCDWRRSLTTVSLHCSKIITIAQRLRFCDATYPGKIPVGVTPNWGTKDRRSMGYKKLCKRTTLRNLASCYTILGTSCTTNPQQIEVSS